MTVSIITFASLGEKPNLKTIDILPVIDEFARQKVLKQVICQINSRFCFSGTVAAIPLPLYYSMRAIEKLLGIRFSRETMERLFDFIASLRLKRANIYLFHGGHFLPRTFRKARALGGIIVELATGAHLRTSSRLEAEEFEKLGLLNPGTEAALYARSPHVDHFDYVIAPSEFARMSYVDAGYMPGRVFLAPFDVDLARFTPANRDPRSPFIALYVAHTTPLKGLHYLLDAWRKISLPNAQLIIVGGTSPSLPPPLLERYKETLGTLANVSWIPTTPTPEVYYRQASVFVFPSLTEGLSRAILEAMACGLPVIVTDNARGLVEDGKTGFVVPIRDSEALREKIEYLHCYPEIARNLGIAGRKLLENKKPFGKAVFDICKSLV